MPEPYIAEVQAAEWVSDGIRNTFRAAGFELRDWPLTQHLEKIVPADRAFFSFELSKLFGLQYKTLYGNGKDFWLLDYKQHETLQRFPWIFYCCSELKDVRDQAIALFFARFYRTRSKFRRTLPTSRPLHPDPDAPYMPYVRWGSLYRDLKSCRAGARVTSLGQLFNLLGPISGPARIRELGQMGEIFLPDFERRTVLAERLFRR